MIWAICVKNRSGAKHIRLSSWCVAVEKMSKGMVKKELTFTCDSMSLTERRRQAMNEIEELELEKEVAELEEKKRELRAEQERRL